MYKANNIDCVLIANLNIFYSMYWFTALVVESQPQATF